MINKLTVKASIISFIGVSLVACGASLKEYQKFALAGKDYATALDTLLVTSGNYFVDADSEILLRSDLQDPDIDKKNYNQITALDEEWLVLVARMRQHTDLLKRYFLALETLATSDAPEKAGQATEKIVQQLNNVGVAIQASPLISNNVGSSLSPIPKIILSEKIRGALREELEKRKDVIYREISIQEYVVKLLTTQLQKNLKIIRDSQDNRLILPPYADTKPISNPDEWIAQRRDIRTMTLSIEALNNASQASEEFKEAFQSLLEDKFTIERANALLSDVESLLSVAEELKKQTNKQQES